MELDELIERDKDTIFYLKLTPNTKWLRDGENTLEVLSRSGLFQFSPVTEEKYNEIFNKVELIETFDLKVNRGIKTLYNWEVLKRMSATQLIDTIDDLKDKSRDEIIGMAYSLFSPVKISKFTPSVKEIWNDWGKRTKKYLIKNYIKPHFEMTKEELNIDVITPRKDIRASIYIKVGKDDIEEFDCYLYTLDSDTKQYPLPKFYKTIKKLIFKN